jgi:hypothetical protein
MYGCTFFVLRGGGVEELGPGLWGHEHSVVDLLLVQGRSWVDPLRFLLKKELTVTDVGELGRIVLPKVSILTTFWLRGCTCTLGNWAVGMELSA